MSVLVSVGSYSHRRHDPCIGWVSSSDCGAVRLPGRGVGAERDRAGPRERGGNTMSESIYRVTEVIGNKPDVVGGRGEERGRDRGRVAPRPAGRRDREARRHDRGGEGVPLPGEGEHLVQVRARVISASAWPATEADLETSQFDLARASFATWPSPEKATVGRRVVHRSDRKRGRGLGRARLGVGGEHSRGGDRRRVARAWPDGGGLPPRVSGAA